MRLARPTVLLAFAAPVAAAVLCTCAAAQPPAPTATQPERLTGTVSAVNQQARTFDLLTAVGHSLRVRRILQPAGVTIEPRGGVPAIPALYPGCIVRVECTAAPTGAVASKIELLQSPPAGRRP